MYIYKYTYTNIIHLRCIYYLSRVRHIKTYDFSPGGRIARGKRLLEIKYRCERRVYVYIRLPTNRVCVYAMYYVRFTVRPFWHCINNNFIIAAVRVTLCGERVHYAPPPPPPGVVRIVEIKRRAVLARRLTFRNPLCVLIGYRNPANGPNDFYSRQRIPPRCLNTHTQPSRSASRSTTDPAAGPVRL